MNAVSVPPTGLALICAVKVERCVDSETVFAALAEEWQRRGLRLGGVQQINVQREDRCRCDMKLKDLATGRVIAISEDRGPEARGCRLDRGALAEATERVLQSIRDGVDLVVVNKFGKAESEGGGMRDVLALALEFETPVLVCANPEHHPNLMAFAGDLAVELPLSAPDIAHWATSVMRHRRPALAA